LEHGVVCWNKN